jgi:Glycosyltransferase family 92
MSIVPEFIQHHVNVGVDQIMLGIKDVNDMDYFQTNLSQFLEQGVLVLGSLHHPTIFDPTIVHPQEQGVKGQDNEIMKLRFYNTCLYHAKSISEYLVIWDIDELWMPPVDSYYEKNMEEKEKEHPPHHHHHHNHSRKEQVKEKSLPHKSNKVLLWKSSPYHRALSLPAAIRLMRGKGGCTDWCYQTFPSYTVGRPLLLSSSLSSSSSSSLASGVTPTTTSNTTASSSTTTTTTTLPEWQGYYGFTHRVTKLNHIWQKPIIRTKYAHQASFHLAGSCRRPLTPSRGDNDSIPKDEKDDDERYKRDFEDCPCFGQSTNALGTMHHYIDLFYNERSDKIEDFPVLDEYTKYLRPTTIRQLESLRVSE